MSLYRNRGVTLIEILVAISLIVIIAGSCFVAYRSATETLERGEVRVQRLQSARAALDMMVRDIQGALINSANSNIYRLMENSYGIYFTTNAIGVTTDIYRVGYTWQRDNAGNKNLIVRVTNSDYTAASPDPANAVKNINPSLNLLVSENIGCFVTGLSFEYGYYNSSSGANGSFKWIDHTDAQLTDDADSTGWDSDDNKVSNYTKLGTTKPKDGLPQAIRIGLAVQDKARLESSQLIYTIVYLSNAE